MKRYIYLAACLLFPLLSLAKAEFLFRHLNGQNGLSQNTVYAILQDRTGFMWFGTRAGLNRFDGVSMKVYHGNARGLGSDIINVLYEDRHGKIWVGTDEGVFIYSPQTNTFRRFALRSTNGTVISNNVTLIQGHGNRIYIAANEQGLFCYDLKTGKMHNNRLLEHPNVSGLGFDRQGTMWIGFFGGGLYFSYDNLHTLHPFSDKDGQQREPLANDIISSIVDAGNGIVMIGSDRHGLCEINVSTHAMRPILSKENGKNIFVRALIADNGKIWAASEQGLYVYNTQDNSIRHYFYEASNPYSLSDNPLYCICRDKDGGIWIGSYFGGVNYLPTLHPQFERFIPFVGRENTLYGQRVRELCQDKNGNIWIGTEDGGLNCMDPSHDLFTFVTESAAFPNIHGLCADDNMLWVGTFSYGVRLIDIRTKKVVRAFVADGAPGSLQDNTVFSICRSRTGTIWLGTIRGLCSYDRKARTFHYEQQIPRVLINDVKEDRNGTLWVVTQTNGIYCLRDQQTRWRHYAHSDRSKSIPTNKILSIFEDHTGQIWFASQGKGIFRYDERNDSFLTVPFPRHNPVQTIFQIVEDGSGIFWLTTYNGIIRYDVRTGDYRFFTKADGLPDTQFNYSSSLIDNSGRIYFGSLEGFVRFAPQSLKAMPTVPKIVATELRIGNSVMEYDTHETPLKRSITFTNELSLPMKQNAFSLHMAVLCSANYPQALLEYTLEGYDKDWQDLRSDNYIAYTNLPAGQYTLLVRAKQGDGPTIKSQYQLKITVRPYWWLSIWAKMLYILLAVVVIWRIYRYVVRRLQYKRKRAIELFEHKKEQELYQSKIRFFTNVAHEIRTPLTLIKGPLENIIGSGKIVDTDVKDDLDIMCKNANRLSDLINQLLDFRRAESNGLRMNFEYCSVNKIVAEVYNRFKPLMREKSISTVLELPPDTIHAYIDYEAVTKIVSNLISNAVKYCDHQVGVTLSREQDEVTLVVSNDGRVIPKVMREKIFMPFFRLDAINASCTTGTGIGLAISRSMAELHHGSLVMDNVDDMNVFRLTFPVNQEEAIKWADANTADTDDGSADTTAGQVHFYTVLIVEDNVQMREYEKKKLQKEYNVLTAADGEEALRILADDNTNVNAIVSDIMMEPMDGLALCRAVKQNVTYSHIPVILLTAVTMETAKTEGMESGADAYIVKPFSMDYLISTIDNLLTVRENIQKAYACSPFVTSESVSISKGDLDFLHKLEKVVDKNMSDSEFNVNRMAEEMNMSRTSLNRKIRSTLNVSPNDFIKLERLKHAAMLLKTNNIKINEVCYMVGFGSPSYFTKCFYKQFGLLPKDFVEGKDA